MGFLTVELEIGSHPAFRIAHEVQKRGARLFPTLVSIRDLRQEFTNHSVHRRFLLRRDDASPFEDVVLNRQGNVLQGASPQLHITSVADWPPVRQPSVPSSRAN